jgi:hypothetical protein
MKAKDFIKFCHKHRLLIYFNDNGSMLVESGSYSFSADTFDEVVENIQKIEKERELKTRGIMFKKHQVYKTNGVSIEDLKRFLPIIESDKITKSKQE